MTLSPALRVPFVIPAQVDTNVVVNGVIFAALAGAVLYAVCRSSRRN